MLIHHASGNRVKLLKVGDVTCDASTTETVGDFASKSTAALCDYDLRAVFGEQLRRGETEPARATHDHRYLAVESLAHSVSCRVGTTPHSTLSGVSIPKLVVFDVDGTLIDWHGNISADTHRTLQRLRQLDVTIAVATGRPLAIAEHTLDQIGGADWMVCSNGSALFEVTTGTMLRDQVLPGDSVEPAIRAMRNLVPGIGVAIDVGSMIIEEAGFSDRVPEEPTAPPVEDALVALATIDGAVRRVIFFHADYDERLDDLAARVRTVIDARCQVQYGGLPIVDISPAGDHKAVALQVLIEHLGIAVDEVIAFGDGGNDIEMLQWAGTGVAMGNARPAVQAVADHVTDSVDALGISAFLGPLLDRS